MLLILYLMPLLAIATTAAAGVVILLPIFAVIRLVPLPWGRVPRCLSVPMKLLLGYVLLITASLGSLAAGEAGHIPVNSWTVFPVLAAYAIVFVNGALIHVAAGHFSFLFDKAAWADWGVWAAILPAVLVMIGVAVGIGRWLWPRIPQAALAWTAQFRPHVVATGALLAVAWAISALGLPRPTGAPDIGLLQAYLKANYDAELGLYREAPNVAPNIFWVYSDGYLAGADVTRYDVIPLRRWHVLRGDVVSPDLFTFGSKTRFINTRVRSEEPDPSVVFNDWREYANRLLLGACPFSGVRRDLHAGDVGCSPPCRGYRFGATADHMAG